MPDPTEAKTLAERLGRPGADIDAAVRAALDERDEQRQRIAALEAQVAEATETERQRCLTLILGDGKPGQIRQDIAAMVSAGTGTVPVVADLRLRLAAAEKERDEARAINQRSLLGIAEKVRAEERALLLRSALLYYGQHRSGCEARTRGPEACGCGFLARAALPDDAALAAPAQKTDLAALSASARFTERMHQRGRREAFEAVCVVISEEPEYPTPWPEEKQREFKADPGASPQLFAQCAVYLTKKSLLSKIRALASDAPKEERCLLCGGVACIDALHHRVRPVEPAQPPASEGRPQTPRKLAQADAKDAPVPPERQAAADEPRRIAHTSEECECCEVAHLADGDALRLRAELAEKTTHYEMAARTVDALQKKLNAVHAALEAKP